MSWHIVVLDVETSGPYRVWRGEVPYHNLLEIGAVYLILGRESRIVDEYYGVLKPVTPHFDAESIRYTGGGSMEYYLERGGDPRGVLSRFYDFLLRCRNPKKGLVYFASDNPEFDVGWVRLYLELFGFDTRIIYHNPMSIKDLARGLTRNMWMNLYRLPEKYRVDMPHTHKALDDARRNAHILMKLAMDLF